MWVVIVVMIAVVVGDCLNMWKLIMNFTHKNTKSVKHVPVPGQYLYNQTFDRHRKTV